VSVLRPWRWDADGSHVHGRVGWVADLVGAHRPSVTTAMGELTRSGAIRRLENGNWMLHGLPPPQLRHHRLVAAMT